VLGYLAVVAVAVRRMTCMCSDDDVDHPSIDDSAAS